MLLEHGNQAIAIFKLFQSAKGNNKGYLRFKDVPDCFVARGHSYTLRCEAFKVKADYISFGKKINYQK